jgi:hypothetical protein
MSPELARVAASTQAEVESGNRKGNDDNAAGKQTSGDRQFLDALPDPEKVMQRPKDTESQDAQ